MSHDVEMDCEPLDLRINRSPKSNVKEHFADHERLDSGYKSGELELESRSGCESITDKFQRDLRINSSSVCSSEERCVSVDEGYAESLKSGDLDKLTSAESESWRPSEKTPTINEVTERESRTSDSIDTLDPYGVYTQDDDGDTQLHTAIIQYLCPYSCTLISMTKHPDFLNIKNSHQQTALHLAVLTKNPLLVRKLMAAGAEVDVPDRHGNTPLHLAAREGHTLITKALLEPITPEEQEEVDYEIPYVKIPQNLEARNYDGQVCLHLAAEGNHQDVLEVLLSKRAEINQRDGKSGRSILHYAAESGNTSLLQFLLQYGSLDINASTYGGQTPYMLAKGRGHNSVIQVLKQARAQYDSSDESVEDEEMNEDSNEEISLNRTQPMNGS